MLAASQLRLSNHLGEEFVDEVFCKGFIWKELQISMRLDIERSRRTVLLEVDLIIKGQ